MPNSKIIKHFSASTKFSDEFSSKDYKTSDYEKYDLDCLNDGLMNLHRAKTYHWENNDYDIDNIHDESYRGSYEILSENETERVIRLNIEFIKDNILKTKETPFNQVIHFYQKDKTTNKGLFSYLREKYYNYFIDPFTKEQDKLFNCLQLSGENDEMRNFELIKKYGDNIIEYLEEKFPEYKIKQGLEYLQQQINPDAFQNKKYKEYWETFKNYMASDFHILIGYITKSKGNIFEAFANFEKSNCFKGFNEILSRRGDNDLKHHFEFYIRVPKYLLYPNCYLIYYDRKILLNKEFVEYKNEHLSLELDEEEIYLRVFENTNKIYGEDLPLDYIKSVLYPELETLKEYGYTDEEKNLKVLKTLAFSPPCLEYLLKKAYEVYITKDQNEIELSNILKYKYNLKKDFYPLFIKLGGNINQIYIKLIEEKYPKEIEFTRSLGLDDFKVSKFLICQTQESFDPKELYDELKYYTFDDSVRKKLKLLGVLYDLDFIRKMNKGEINIDDKISLFFKNVCSHQLQILKSLNFTDEQKNLEMLLNEYRLDFVMDEQFCYYKAIYYYSDEIDLIRKYSKFDVGFYKKYLQSGKSDIREYIKNDILKRFGTIIDELVKIGFNDNEKNWNKILHFDDFEENTFEQHFIENSVYLDYTFSHKLKKFGLNLNKQLYKEYFETAPEQDSLIKKFVKEPLAYRQEELKKYGFDDEEKNLNCFICEVDNPYDEGIENFIQNFLREYIGDDEYNKITNASVVRNLNFYKTYLKFNKDVYLACLHLNFPTWLPFLEKYNDTKYVFYVAKNSNLIAETIEDLLIFIDKIYNYFTTVKNLKMKNKQILFDLVYGQEVYNSDPEEFLYYIIRLIKNFIIRKVIEPTDENSGFYNSRILDEFYLDNEDFILKKIFDSRGKEFIPLLDKFPLSTCVYTLMNICVNDTYQELMDFIHNYIIIIQEKYKVKVDPHDVMLLMGSYYAGNEIILEKFQQLQNLKQIIQETKLANPLRQEAFIVYTMLKKE